MRSGGENHRIQSERARNSGSKVYNNLCSSGVYKADARAVLRRQENQVLLLGRRDELHRYSEFFGRQKCEEEEEERGSREGGR